MPAGLTRQHQKFKPGRGSATPDRGNTVQRRNAWFRLKAEILDDPQFSLLSFEDRWHFIALLCCKRRGLLDRDESADLTMKKVARKLELSIEQLQQLLQCLADVNLVDLATIQPDLRLVVTNDADLRPPPSVWAVIRARIFNRDDYTCRYCGDRGGRLECDHIHPVSKGGSHDDDNLATACFDCNRSKHAKLPSEWSPA